MSLVDSLITNAKSAASRLRVRSALNPVLWMCAIVTPLSFGFAYAFRAEPNFVPVFMFIGDIPVLTAVVGFLYFMINHPEKLQSEEFQLRQQSLEIIKQKGISVELAPSSLEAISSTMNDAIGAKQ